MTKKETIENKVKGLNKVLKAFEEGDMGVEESIEKYTDAKKQVEEIRKELESVELKINQID